MIVIIVCHFPASSPIAASLYGGGTALMASSEDLIMVGRIKRASVKEPARTLLDSETPMVLRKNARPNRPNTILGTPAKVLIQIRIRLIIFPSRAYSQRYIAAMTPNGRANSIAPIVK